MANKMSICIIKYTYTQYVGVDIEKYTRGLFEYVKEAFGEFQPEMSEPGTIPDMPDYLDILLCKKDGSIFYKMDIERRAINIPLDFQLEGLVMEIDITMETADTIYVMEQNTKRYTTLLEGKLQKIR